MFYTNDGLRLSCSEAGKGDMTLLFLHYFGGSSRTWQPVIDLLAADFRCIAMDLRGWGDADTPPTGAECRVERMAGDVEALIATLGLSKYTLIGHSMGGKVAQLLAASRPPGLERLLLIAPSPLSPEPMTEDDRAAMRTAYGSADASRETLQKIACQPLTPETADAVVADNLRASRTAWVAWADTGSREDLSTLAPQIAVPTFVLSGTGDVAVTPETLAQEVIARIPGATLTSVPGAGHLLPVEAPPVVAEWVRSCLPEVLPGV